MTLHHSPLTCIDTKNWNNNINKKIHIHLFSMSKMGEGDFVMCPFCFICKDNLIETVFYLLYIQTVSLLFIIKKKKKAQTLSNLFIFTYLVISGCEVFTFFFAHIHFIQHHLLIFLSLNIISVLFWRKSKYGCPSDHRV